MERGYITHLAVNGAFAYHDLEFGLFNSTSEIVADALSTGSFGLAKEPVDAYNRAIFQAWEDHCGLGESLGKRLAGGTGISVIGTAYTLGIPVTVHLAIGTDVTHMHPSFDPIAAGESTYRDFLILTENLSTLSPQGVLLNVGSAVVLPEVLLKGLALQKAVDPAFGRFTGANFDFVQSYRSNTQVVERVKTCLNGEGFTFTGHHEFMIPLLSYFLLCQNDFLSSAI
jgi:hypothetical protein